MLPLRKRGEEKEETKKKGVDGGDADKLEKYRKLRMSIGCSKVFHDRNVDGERERSANVWDAFPITAALFLEPGEREREAIHHLNETDRTILLLREC